MAPHYVFADEGKAVCAICVNDPSMAGFEGMEPIVTIAEANANARLLQAAPELLEALTELARIFDPNKQCIYEFARPVFDNAIKAIKKATE